MSARPLTDAQVDRALRAHLPKQAAPGLRARVLDEAQTTTQVRSLPSFLGAISDADPVSRRRNLLIAAALLVALALASTAAVGALRTLQQESLPELNVEPPADLPAFVLSSHERLPQLPPVAFTWQDGDSAKGRVYVHGSGTVRFDRFPSADATQPSGSTIVNDNHRISGMALVDAEAVWIEQGHEAIEDDPRVFLRLIIDADGGGPGCEVDRELDEGASGAPATGWRYIGAEYVAGRPTHHVACVGEHGVDSDLWLDIETRLILRVREPLTDDADQPIPGQFWTTEVTEIAFGEQPAALFGPPEGVTRMSADAYRAYICARDVPNELVVDLMGISDSCPTPPDAEAAPLPTPTPTVRPSLAPRPTGPAGPLVWTKASLQEDWPAPVRAEPDGGPTVEPMPLTYFDPTGDTGSDIDPWVDIRGVTGNTSIVHLKLVSSNPPVVDPTEQWIAYGVVIDEDGDGAPDWRYGIDNAPRDAEGEPTSVFNRTRVWRTNLHTGRTDDKGFLSEGYRGVWPNGSDANFEMGGTMDTTQGSVAWGIELDMPFYTWASVIVNGQVVATDYAPDTGWLLATPGAKPGGTHLIEEPFPVHLSMTVPGGWTAEGPWLNSGSTDLQFLVVDSPEDPCPDTIEPTPGPSFDDLVTYLEDLPLIDISDMSDVTIDGYRGVHLEYTPADGDFECHGAPIPIGEDNEVWILDVDGVRLVIAASSSSESETVWKELRQIVESIQIEP